MGVLDPQQTIFYNIEKAIKSYRKFAQKKLSDVVTGITVDQVLILTLLKENPTMAQNEMATVLFKDYASITRMIDLLVKNEYLSRTINESDRRKFVLKISCKGQTALDQLKSIVINNRTTALDGVSESEVKQLDDTLNKIINNCI